MPRSSLIVAVDFDGTIFEHEYPNVGREVPGALAWLRRWAEGGARLILYTMRDGDELTAALLACRSGGVEFWGVNENPDQNWTESRKVFAHVYVDDAAFGCPLITPGVRRPYVDWSVVGPAVETAIMARQR